MRRLEPYRPPLVWRSFLIEALTGLFLCAELDQAVLTVAFHKLRTDPVETPGNLPAIIGVLVAVESFEQKHPLIRAEVNGLSGCRVCHEWVACFSFESSVRFYQWSQASGGSAPINTKPINGQNYDHPLSVGRSTLHSS